MSLMQYPWSQELAGNRSTAAARTTSGQTMPNAFTLCPLEFKPQPVINALCHRISKLLLDSASPSVQWKHYLPPTITQLLSLSTQGRRFQCDTQEAPGTIKERAAQASECIMHLITETSYTCRSKHSRAPLGSKTTQAAERQLRGNRNLPCAAFPQHVFRKRPHKGRPRTPGPPMALQKSLDCPADPLPNGGLT